MAENSVPPMTNRTKDWDYSQHNGAQCLGGSSKGQIVRMHLLPAKENTGAIITMVLKKENNASKMWCHTGILTIVSCHLTCNAMQYTTQIVEFAVPVVWIFDFMEVIVEGKEMESDL